MERALVVLVDHHLLLIGGELGREEGGGGESEGKEDPHDSTFMTLIVMRRFFPRPSGVALSATG